MCDKRFQAPSKPQAVQNTCLMRIGSPQACPRHPSTVGPEHGRPARGRTGYDGWRAGRGPHTWARPPAAGAVSSGFKRQALHSNPKRCPAARGFQAVSSGFKRQALHSNSKRCPAARGGAPHVTAGAGDRACRRVPPRMAGKYVY